MMSYTSRLLLLCALLLACYSSGSVSGVLRCSDEQRSLLLKFKQGFSLSFPYDPLGLGSWVEGSDCCLWDGITCDNITGLVVGLDLYSAASSANPGRNEIFFFAEQIDPSLFELGSLITLDLSSCTIESPFPPGLGQLTNLTYLGLPYVHSFNQIQLEISRLIRLVSLSLYGFDNEKLEKPDLKTFLHNLSSLQVLDLDGIDISPAGREWSQIISSSLPHLRRLILHRCQLSGPIHVSLLQLPFLSKLDLSHNNLLSVTANSSNSSMRLEFLDLSFNHLTGGILEKLANLQSLGILDLSHNSLTGRIPENVGAHSFLDYCDLSYNNLTGGIPLSFGMQTNLSVLSLNNNMLNGTIPSFLLNLPSLWELDLSQNLFHGSLSEITHPLSLSLNWLDLSNNKLSGAVPRSIFHLPEPGFLNLSSNNFKDTIDFGLIPSILNLAILDLSDNSITVKFSNESIEETPSLFEYLILRSCNISELPWGFLHKAQNLVQLDLSDNKIYGAIPNWTWQLKNLRYLNLSHNLLTSIEEPLNFSSSRLGILDLHANMLEGALPIPPFANFLDYSINRFSSIIPANIGSYLNTTYFLSLSGNKFVGEIPPTMCKAYALRVLDMSNNSLSGLIPWCLTNLTPFLSILSLSENDLRGNIPDGFLEICYLRTLDLNSNRLSGPLPKSLLNCTKLEVLDLGSNHLNDTFPFWLKNFSYLSVLVLRSNQFHGPIEANHIRQGFQRLQIIDLSSNSFTGKLPVEYFQSSKVMTKGGETEQEGSELNFLRLDMDMAPVISSNTFRLYYQDVVTLTSKGHVMLFGKIVTIFTLIDLSNNKFHGHIPEELGNLKFLIVLNLSQNSLSGQIPKSLGNLNSIESMDLSHNNLSGEIPIELTRLTFLEVLDLSYNKLVGRIPKGAQFSTFTNGSFEGNPSLCGSPLSSNCTSTPIVQPTEGEATIDEVDRLEFLVGGILGFFCGMALVIWPLFFWTKWRKWYYNHVDKMLLKIATCASCRRG